MKNYRLVHLRCEQYQLSTAGKRLKISIVRTRKKKDLSKNILTKIKENKSNLTLHTSRGTLCGICQYITGMRVQTMHTQACIQRSSDNNFGQKQLLASTVQMPILCARYTS